MDERKLNKLEKLLEIADEDTVSNDDFVAAFEVVVSLVREGQSWTEEQIDEFRGEFAELKRLNDKQWDAIKKKVALIRNGKDGADGRDGKDGAPGRDGKDGKDGAPGKDGLPGKDAEPETGEQVIEKINKADKQISKDRIEGFADVERIAKANAVGGGIGVTKQELETRILGVNTHRLTVSDTAPLNPKLNDLWVDIS